MRRLILSAVWVLTAGEIMAQLLSSVMDLQDSNSKSTRVEIQPVVVDANKMRTWFKIAYKEKIDSWAVEMHASTMEKLNPSGVFYDVRRNHIHLSQVVSRTLKGRFTTLLSVANHSFWDVTTTEFSRNTTEVSVLTRFDKITTVALTYQNWNDVVLKSFEMGETTIAPGNYSFNTFSTRYTRNGQQLFSTAEARLGKFYDHDMVALKLGGGVRIFQKVQIFADTEYTLMLDEQSPDALRITGSLKYNPARFLSTSLFVINNGFMRLTGIFANVCLQKRGHELTVECRELRNARFEYVTTSAPMFASKWLIQYRYSFRSKEPATPDLIGIRYAGTSRTFQRVNRLSAKIFIEKP